MEQNEYVEDFSTIESKQEFEGLLSQAISVHNVEVGHQADRSEKYADAGKYIVDHCDILIAIWDGNPAKGEAGTGAIVSYARDKTRRPYTWINPNDPSSNQFINFEEIYVYITKRLLKRRVYSIGRRIFNSCFLLVNHLIYPVISSSHSFF